MGYGKNRKLCGRKNLHHTCIIYGKNLPNSVNLKTNVLESEEEILLILTS